MYLFDVADLKYCTVSTYRSSLCGFLYPLGLSQVNSHPLISDLFSHYQRAVPKRELKPPGWDFNLALHWLKSPPFEPLRTANMRDLTTKTVFLVGFALSARICELHGLSGKVCFGREGISAVLTYDDQFWLKTENTLREVKRTIVLPCLYAQTDEREVLLHCPVRALKFYLRRKAAVGAGDRFLFVAPSNSARRASRLGLTPLVNRVVGESHLESELPGDRVLEVVTNSRLGMFGRCHHLFNLSLTSRGWISRSQLFGAPTPFLPPFTSERGGIHSTGMECGDCGPEYACGGLPSGLSPA